MLPRYPVYLPTKGRYDKSTAFTIRALRRDAVPFYAVVEPQEADTYARIAGRDRLLILPFSNLGRGSIPARNWIRDHAEAEGYARHWQLDDNISIFYRLWHGRRVPVHAGVALRVCEDLTDRFSNVGISGLNYTMFVPRDTPAPYASNRHVYSCTLVNHEMPYRWRGRLNEDTDLCLQALTTGWATLLVNAFNCQKLPTMVLKGGNTNDLYRNQGEEDERDTAGRYEMARVLEREWPGLVKVARKFGRYQHSVNWRAFDVPLRLRDGARLEALPEVDEYGLSLRTVREIRSERVRDLLAGYSALVAEARAPDPLWRGLPAFEAVPEPVRVSIRCASESERARLVERLGVTIAKKTRGTWSAWWPPRGRDDNASLRFEPEPCPS